MFLSQKLKMEIASEPQKLKYTKEANIWSYYYK